MNHEHFTDDDYQVPWKEPETAEVSGLVLWVVGLGLTALCIASWVLNGGAA